MTLIGKPFSNADAATPDLTGVTISQLNRFLKVKTGLT